MTFGILMIATNKYTKLWQQTVEDLMKHELSFAQQIHIHLFTDQAEEMIRWWRAKGFVAVLITHPIPNLIWPDATLLRYKLISEVSSEFTEDVLVYLDSDMQINSPFLSTLKPMDWRNGIALVSHPGFFRRNGMERVIDYFKFPSLIPTDFRNFAIFQPHPGAWETRKISKSYVPLFKRKTYVHGAIWMGRRDELLKMVRVLTENTATDLNSGLIAKWHDESHLNWYASNNEVTLLDPTYSGYSEYPWLNRYQSKIETVNKAKIGFFTLGKNDH